MSYFVYILYSDVLSRYYTGLTANIENRIREHNSGETISIKRGIPWRLVWSEKVASRSEATILETKIKKRGALRFLQDRNVA